MKFIPRCTPARAEKVRVVLFFMFAALIGWNANNFTRYCEEIYRKAALCDQIECDHLQETAERIQALELPLTKPRKVITQ